MHRVSYWKTTAMSIVVAALSLAAIFALCLASATTTFVASGVALLAAIFALSSLVACGGLVCLWRDAQITAGKVDPYAASTNRVPAPSLFTRFGLRFMLGAALRPGDIVQVRPISEIQKTLGDEDTLDGLPFMVEMAPFCGRIFRVHRRVDKINDMRNKTGLRRMHDAVTLTDMRCSGAAHSGCQAECQILWKDAWLVKMAAVSLPLVRPVVALPNPLPAEIIAVGEENRHHVCQMTRLWEASRRMSPFDIRQDLRPLAWGNIGVGAYCLAMFTRLFNEVQRVRGGSDFPAMPLPTGVKAVSPHQPALVDNQPVIVRSREEIAATLTNNRTRGLWYDRDMVRFSGHPAQVYKRVDRLIHEGTGKMVVMKTPCVVLEGVVATGEFLRLCPQHEYIFWREAWLQPSGNSVGSAPASDLVREMP